MASRYTVRADDPRLRIDRFAAERLGVPSRARARKLIKRGLVILNGAPVETSRFVRDGDVIELLPPPDPPEPWERELAIAWQDEHFAVVVKPPGVPTSGNRGRTLARALPFNLGPSPAPDALLWPRPVHRLDVRTSGLVVVARAAAAEVALNRAFQERRVHKRYRAVVVGRLEGEGIVEEPIEGRPARSRWRAVEHTPDLHVGCLTTVDLWPETGRTHQLRLHLAGLGHPVLGDDLHGQDHRVLRRAGLFLAACELGLEHPISGKALTIAWPEPTKFGTWRARARRRAERWIAEHGALP